MSRSMCLGDFLGREKVANIISGQTVVEVISDHSIKNEPAPVATESVPPEILRIMASAMLEPDLGKTPSDLGNKVRQIVLQRALAAAEEKGWWLSKRD